VRALPLDRGEEGPIEVAGLPLEAARGDLDAGGGERAAPASPAGDLRVADTTRRTPARMIASTQGGAAPHVVARPSVT
jgi:hypothetical protein